MAGRLPKLGVEAARDSRNLFSAHGEHHDPGEVRSARIRVGEVTPEGRLGVGPGGIIFDRLPFEDARRHNAPAESTT
jgi:hypothetical protein